MRVLFATHNFPRVPGDAPGNFILRLAVALRDHGVAVRVVAPHAPGLDDHATIEGIGVTRFHYAPDARETLAYGGTMAAQVRGSWRAKRDLVSFIRAESRALSALATTADVVHAHWWFPSGLAATRARLGRPLITTLHGSDVRFARGAFGRRLMRHVLARSARVTAVSRWLASEAASPGVAPIVASMPVDMEIFSPTGEPRDGLLFVGKLDAQKGLHVLLEAMRRVPSATLTVVGDGPDASALHARAAALGVAARVRWCGALPHAELPTLYRRAQLLVAPATEPEGLGLVAVEALLCETPVIASDIGGIPDVVEDGVTGRLVRASDPIVLAVALDAALSAPDSRAAWGREGRMRMLGRFAPETCAGAFRALYDEVVRGARA